MKLRINGKEMDTIEICGILSFLFDETIKKRSYNISSNKHFIEFKIVLKEPFEQQKMNIITIVLN